MHQRSTTSTILLWALCICGIITGGLMMNGPNEIGYVFAALTAILGVTFGIVSSSSHHGDSGSHRSASDQGTHHSDRDSDPPALQYARTGALWFTAVCGVLLGFTPDSYHQLLGALTVLGGVTMGVLWAFHLRSSRSQSTA